MNVNDRFDAMMKDDRKSVFDLLAEMLAAAEPIPAGLTLVEWEKANHARLHAAGLDNFILGPIADGTKRPAGMTLAEFRQEFSRFLAEAEAEGRRGKGMN